MMVEMVNYNPGVLFNIGDNIQIYQKKKNISTAELARRCNLGRKTIYRLCEGYSATNIYNLIKICEVLGITLDTLVSSPKE